MKLQAVNGANDNHSNDITRQFLDDINVALFEMLRKRKDCS